MNIIIFIVGPTAVGKTDVAFYLAKGIGGEIISCDSMQVYREIAIASNKPSGDVLKTVKHYLIDEVSVEEPFDVFAFNKRALQTVQDILNRGRIPVITGGSGLYMQVLLDGIFEGAGKDALLREQLTREAEEKGAEVLFQRLKRLDPQTAQNIHPHDVKKLIRALEVCLKEQKPLSQIKHNRSGLWGKYDIKLFALTQKREKLYDKINRRVDAMFDAGIVDEIKALEGRPLSLTAKGLIGVKEIRGYLAGKYDLERARELMKLNTRHFAKRQMTWFRRDKRIVWVDVDDYPDYQHIAKAIKQKIKFE